VPIETVHADTTVRSPILNHLHVYGTRYISHTVKLHLHFAAWRRPSTAVYRTHMGGERKREGWETLGESSEESAYSCFRGSKVSMGKSFDSLIYTSRLISTWGNETETRSDPRVRKAGVRMDVRQVSSRASGSI